MTDIQDIQQEYAYGYSAPLALAFAQKFNTEIAVFSNKHDELFHVAAVSDVGEYIDAHGVVSIENITRRYTEREAIKIEVYPSEYFSEKYPFSLHGLEQAMLDALYLIEQGLVPKA